MIEGHQRTGGTLCSFIGKHAHHIKACSNHRLIRIPPQVLQWQPQAQQAGPRVGVSITG